MATAELTLEAELRAIRLEKQAAETELEGVESRRRELRAAVKDCDRRIGELIDDLVVDRPLLDFAAGRPGPAPVAIEEMPDGQPAEAPAYTWHSYPMEKVLGEEHEELAGQLLAEDLGTLGAIASWLGDGNDLDEIEVPTHDQGDKTRLLGSIECRDLRASLLAKIEELGIAPEFPPSWVDPDLMPRALWRVEFAKAKAGPPIFLRAFTKMQAAAEAGRRWPDSRAVAAHVGEPPEGARVFDAPRETPEERAEQFAAEERARRADEARERADREARESEERARAEEEAAREAPPKPSPRKAAKAGARPAPEPEGANGLFLFAVRPSKAKPPLYYVRARSLKEAAGHVKASHPRDARMLVSPHGGPAPEGAWIQAAR